MIQDYCRGDIFFIAEGAYTGSDKTVVDPVLLSQTMSAINIPLMLRSCFLSREKEAHAYSCRSVVQGSVNRSLRKHSDCIKERLDSFIRSCTTSEMKNIDNALLCSLGLHAPAVSEGGLKFLQQLLRLFPEAEIRQKLSTRLCMNSFLDKVMVSKS